MCLALSKWMVKNRLTQYAFHKRYPQISQPFLNQILSGARKAGVKTAKRIEQITNGEVTYKDLRPDRFEVRDAE